MAEILIPRKRLREARYVRERAIALRRHAQCVSVGHGNPLHTSSMAITAYQTQIWVWGRTYSWAAHATGPHFLWDMQEYGTFWGLLSDSQSRQSFRRLSSRDCGNWRAVSVCAGAGRLFALKELGDPYIGGIIVNIQTHQDDDGEPIMHLRAPGSTGQNDTSVFNNPPYLAVSAGHFHAIALKTDGHLEVINWPPEQFRGHGDINYGGDAVELCPQPSDGPFMAISAGTHHSVALRYDGMAVCWGWDFYGESPQNPVPGPFIAVSAGKHHTLAVREDGNISCWGWNHSSQAPPQGVVGQFVAVAAGDFHSLALHADGSIWFWGDALASALNSDSSALEDADAGSWLLGPIRPHRMSGGVPGPGPIYVSIAAGGIASAAVDQTGRLHTWHSGDYPVADWFRVRGHGPPLRSQN